MFWDTEIVVKVGKTPTFRCYLNKIPRTKNGGMPGKRLTAPVSSQVRACFKKWVGSPTSGNTPRKRRHLRFHVFGHFRHRHPADKPPNLNPPVTNKYLARDTKTVFWDTFSKKPYTDTLTGVKFVKTPVT